MPAGSGLSCLISLGVALVVKRGGDGGSPRVRAPWAFGMQALWAFGSGALLGLGFEDDGAGFGVVADIGGCCGEVGSIGDGETFAAGGP